MSAPAKKLKTSSEFAEEMGDEFTLALEEIDGCQNEIDVLNEKASEEILKVEQKYNKLRKPLFEKRTSLLKKIPDFWITAFLNHPQISSIVDEEEEECFQHLDILEVEETDDIKTGYHLHFHFKENSYFTNKCLTKSFNLGTTGQPMSTSSAIEWREGKDLIKQLHSKTQTGRRKRHLEFKTFFDWFCDNGDPVNDEIAETIKDDLWPNPLQYFLVPDIEVEGEEENEDDPSEELGDEEQHDEDEEDEEDNGALA